MGEVLFMALGLVVGLVLLNGGTMTREEMQQGELPVNPKDENPFSERMQ